MSTPSRVPATAISLYVELVSSAQADETPSLARDYLSVLACYLNKNGSADALLALHNLPALTTTAGGTYSSSINADKIDKTIAANLLESNLKTYFPLDLVKPLAKALTSKIPAEYQLQKTLKLTLLFANSTVAGQPAMGGLEATLTCVVAPKEKCALSDPGFTLTIDSNLAAFNWTLTETAAAQSFITNMRAQGNYLELLGTKNFQRVAY